MDGPILSLRRASLADAWTVRALVREAYAKWVPLIGREPKPMSADYDAAVRDHLVDLLHVDFDLAGIVEMIPEDGQLLIENVAVAPAFQGRGYGRRLLAHAEAVAQALSLPRIRLYTNHRFAENIALYERAGYSRDREEDMGVAIAVHMSKRVDL
jgi:ribosomal protein S18 acetylase RimI-like enzyme